MIDQFDVVTTNVTNIDRLKGAHFGFEQDNEDESKASAAVNEVFGGKCGFHMHWISPLVGAVFPNSMRDEIMGFCTPCTTRGELELKDRGIVIRNVEEMIV